MPRDQLFFTCPKCGWWAIGERVSQEPVEQDKLPDAKFDVKCSVGNCGWTGQLPGKDGRSPKKKQSE